MREDCLQSIGWPEGKCSRFDTNPAEGGNNAYKTITRGLWNNFVKRGIQLDQMCEGDYCWYMAVWNRVLATLRGDKNDFGGLKQVGTLVAYEGTNELAVPIQHTLEDPATGLKEGPWECQLRQYIDDVCAGKRAPRAPRAPSNISSTQSTQSTQQHLEHPEHPPAFNRTQSIGTSSNGTN